MGLYGFLYLLFLENKDALLAIPSSIKTIVAVSLLLTIGLGLLKSMFRLVKVAVIVAACYFIAVYAEVI